MQKRAKSLPPQEEGPLHLLLGIRHVSDPLGSDTMDPWILRLKTESYYYLWVALG